VPKGKSKYVLCSPSVYKFCCPNALGIYFDSYIIIVGPVKKEEILSIDYSERKQNSLWLQLNTTKHIYFILSWQLVSVD
jgi:hypothetical protein